MVYPLANGEAVRGILVELIVEFGDIGIEHLIGAQEDGDVVNPLEIAKFRTDTIIVDIQIALPLIAFSSMSSQCFYKHYYLVKDVLKKDVQDITQRAKKTMSHSLYQNWFYILEATYQHKGKLLLMIKAGMEIDILNNLNGLTKEGDGEELMLAWSGIIYDEIIAWAKKGFEKTPEELAKKLTSITESIARNPN